jgi:23S rRNA (uridine2552-2'-O)-methyltransferase
MARFIHKDPFYKKAKQEGFRARSAYKLKEIEDRFHLLHKGDVVLDLGCSPGSFLQVLSGWSVKREPSSASTFSPRHPFP